MSIDNTFGNEQDLAVIRQVIIDFKSHISSKFPTLNHERLGYSAVMVHVHDSIQTVMTILTITALPKLLDEQYKIDAYKYMEVLNLIGNTVGKTCDNEEISSLAFYTTSMLFYCGYMKYDKTDNSLIISSNLEWDYLSNVNPVLEKLNFSEKLKKMFESVENLPHLKDTKEIVDDTFGEMSNRLYPTVTST